MPSIFPKTEAYFTSFYNERLELYRAIANDFHPTRHHCYAYVLNENHRRPVHLTILGFTMQFGHNEDLRSLRVPEDYSTPKKAIQEIISFKKFLENDLASLETLKQEYTEVDSDPYPLITAIKKTKEVIEMLEYVLTFDELTPYLDEELYNIYIGIPWNHECYYALNKQDIEKIFGAIKEAKEYIRIDGRKIRLKGFDSFLIYNNLFAPEGSDKARLKDIIPKTQSIHNFKLKTELLSFYGQDVTSQFNVPDPPEEIIQENRPLVKSESNKNKSKRIFVSHSSKDEDLVTKFVDTVLILGMGVKREDIFYTSGVGTGIKTGQDFKQRITNEIKEAKAVIQFLTPNYKESEVCLNEMGAAWAITEIIIPLLGPPYNYDTGFLHASDQQVKLNNKHALMSMFDDHKTELFDEKQRSGVLSTKIDEFVKYLESIEMNSKEN